MSYPKRFSVIMPVYNGEILIRESLDSLIKNFTKNDELIIINDNSTDNTVNVIKKFLLKKIDYKIISLKKNIGPTKARNIGLNNAKGRFITFLDHDDYFPNKRLLKHEKIFNKYKNIDAVRGLVRLVFANKKTLNLFYKFNTKIKNWRLLKNSECFGAISFKRKVFNKIRLDNKLKYGEDTDLIFKIKMSNFKFYNQNKLALYYRIHPNSRSATQKNAMFGSNPSPRARLLASRKLILKSIINNFKNRKKYI
jgi:glycosyltransferase involved in cell wall biosynthesis